MKIKINSLIEAMEKVAVATGKDDTVKVSFDNNPKTGKMACTLGAYNGRNLQVLQQFNVEDETPGTYVLRCSKFLSALKACEALGVAEVVLEMGEKSIILKDGENRVEFPLLEGCSLLNIKDALKGQLVRFSLADTEGHKGLKQFSAVCRNASRFTAEEGKGLLSGIMFAVSDKGYYIRATSGLASYRTEIETNILAAKDHSREEGGFFVSPAIVTAVEAMRGDIVDVVVAEKFVVMADKKGCRAIVPRAFSVQGGTSLEQIEKMFRQVETPIEEGSSYRLAVVKAKKADIAAICGLCELSSVDEHPRVRVKLVPAGDKFECWLEEAGGRVSRCLATAEAGAKEGASDFSVKKLLNSFAAIRSAEITVEVGSNLMMRVFEGDAKIPSVIIMGVKGKPAAAKAEKGEKDK